MRYRQSEKMEIIRLVEQSPLSVKQTLAELNINRSTFYKWYRRYQEGGYQALANRYRPPKQFWNQIPPWERQRVVEIALEHPEKSPRELAWYITDKQGYYISESSVYRILKAHDLVTSPVYTVITAQDKFPHPSRAPNELWQTDFTWFKVVHSGAGTICAPFWMIIRGIYWPGTYVPVCPPRRFNKRLRRPSVSPVLGIQPYGIALGCSRITAPAMFPKL